jgi:hypothetical protein
MFQKFLKDTYKTITLEELESIFDFLKTKNEKLLIYKDLKTVFTFFYDSSYMKDFLISINVKLIVNI